MTAPISEYSLNYLLNVVISTPFGTFRVGRDGTGEASPFWLQFSLKAPDYRRGGAASAWRGRKWRISTYSTEREIVGTAFAAVLQAMEHEIRESFLVDGSPVFGPHLPLGALKVAGTLPPDERHPRQPQPA